MPFGMVVDESGVQGRRDDTGFAHAAQEVKVAIPRLLEQRIIQKEAAGRPELFPNGLVFAHQSGGLGGQGGSGQFDRGGLRVGRLATRDDGRRADVAGAGQRDGEGQAGPVRIAGNFLGEPEDAVGFALLGRWNFAGDDSLQMPGLRGAEEKHIATGQGADFRGGIFSRRIADHGDGAPDVEPCLIRALGSRREHHFAARAWTGIVVGVVAVPAFLRARGWAAEFLDLLQRRQRHVESGVQPGVPDVVLGQHHVDLAAGGEDQTVDVAIADDQRVPENAVGPAHANPRRIQCGRKRITAGAAANANLAAAANRIRPWMSSRFIGTSG